MQLSSDRIAIKANIIRQNVVRMLECAGSGHSASSLGLADIYATLYFKLLNYQSNEPDWSSRDYLIVSNGHTAPVLYAAMAEAGYFDRSELYNLRKLGSILQGHPERIMIPGVETTSGPLGSGLSQASGIAYVLQYLDYNPHRFVYTMLGDGELNEGNIWEAAMFANKYKLGNIIAIIDRNNIQIDGQTEDVMPLGNLREKWESFGWHVQEIDGHNIDEITSSVEMAKAITNKPSAIIAYTIPGKGADFMEYDYKWHGKVPNNQQADYIVNKLKADYKSLQQEAKDV